MQFSYWDQMVLGLAAATSLGWLWLASWADRYSRGKAPELPPLPPRKPRRLEARHTRKTVRLSPDMQSMLERMAKHHGS